METQNTFTKIFENQSVTVSALLCAETLKITVKVNDETNEHFGSVFTAEITEQQRNESLNEYFDNLNEVLYFIENNKRIKVDWEERTIIFYEIILKKKQIILFKTELIKEEKTINENDLQCLEQISNRCLQKGEIHNDQIKKYFEIIANELISLRKEKVNKNEQNEMKQEIKNEFVSQQKQILKIQQQSSFIQKEFQNKIEESSEKLTQFTDKICQLQKQMCLQNKQTQKMKAELQQKSKDKFTELTDKICELQKQISLRNNENQKDKIYELQKQICLQNEKIQILEMEINQKSQKIAQIYQKKKLSLSENNFFSISKFQNKEQKFMSSESKMNYPNNIVKSQEQKQSKLQKQKQKQVILMQKCKNQINSNDFNFDGKTLTQLNKNSNYFTFFEQIIFDVQFTFNVKIIQMKYCIEIGVIDYEDFAKNKMNKNNHICYNSDGDKNLKSINQGNGFQVGDSVTVKVNRNTKTIKWFVNKKLQATDNAQFLGYRKRKLFPFVALWGQHDKIKFAF